MQSRQTKVGFFRPWGRKVVLPRSAIIVRAEYIGDKMQGIYIADAGDDVMEDRELFVASIGDTYDNAGTRIVGSHGDHIIVERRAIDS